MMKISLFAYRRLIIAVLQNPQNSSIYKMGLSSLEFRKRLFLLRRFNRAELLRRYGSGMPAWVACISGAAL